MTVNVQHVPVNGFNVPPANPNPPQAAGDQQAPGGFNVPPAGPPPRMPGGNGAPHQYVGQQPGFVDQRGVQPPPGQQPAQQAPQSMDPNALAALLQAALGGAQPQQPAAAPPAAPASQPSWVPQNANTFDVTQVEDPIIRSMATVLQHAGKDLDLNRVLGNALALGDPNLIDNAYIAEKGGAAAQQIAEIAKGIVQQVAAKSAAITADIHASVGGEAAWSAATAAFNQGAPQELRVTVTQMLNSTNPAFIKAGAKIVAEFGRVSGRIPQAGSPLLNGASAPTAFAQGLSRADFQAELRKLKPDEKGFEAAREALFARRSAGKRAGLN